MRARDNPFRSERIDSLAFRDPHVTSHALLERWQRRGRRGALVGPHGTGKTTLLGDLVHALELRGRHVERVRLVADERAIPMRTLRAAIERCGPRGVMCLDGFDVLPWPTRLRTRWALRRVHGVLVTSHRACPYPTLHEMRTTADLLSQLVGELLGSEADGFRPLVERLHARCGGNVRDALFALYEHAARNRLRAGDPGE